MGTRQLGSHRCNLLVRCAEMNHLARFLSELYDAFGNE
jgi:hypothetical protein